MINGNIDIIKYRQVKDYINTSNEAKHWAGQVDFTGNKKESELAAKIALRKIGGLVLQ